MIYTRVTNLFIHVGHEDIFTVSAWFFTIVPGYDPLVALQSTPWFQTHYDLTLAALGKKIKKQQQVSDLNQE